MFEQLYISTNLHRWCVVFDRPASVVFADSESSGFELLLEALAVAMPRFRETRVRVLLDDLRSYNFLIEAVAVPACAFEPYQAFLSLIRELMLDVDFERSVGWRKHPSLALAADLAGLAGQRVEFEPRALSVEEAVSMLQS